VQNRQSSCGLTWKLTIFTANAAVLHLQAVMRAVQRKWPVDAAVVPAAHAVKRLKC
jgi:hypothetical protein